MRSPKRTGGPSEAFSPLSGIQVPERSKTPLKRPNSRVWERLRRRALDRDGWTCQNSSCSKSAGRFEVDHVIPLIHGGTSELSNLQVLCRSCHFSKTRTENNPKYGCPELAKWQAFVKQLMQD